MNELLDAAIELVKEGVLDRVFSEAGLGRMEGDRAG